MSDGYRNGAFALGLVTGGGIVLNLVLWSAYSANESRESISKAPKDTQRHPWIEPWDWLISTFINPYDTIAQWGMALLSLAAVYLLWETLKASRTTLKATREMAAETARVGEAQVMAYLSIDATTVDISVRDNLVSIIVKPEIRNSGQSPARKIRVQASIKGVHDGPSMYAAQSDLMAGEGYVGIQPIQSTASFADIGFNESTREPVPIRFTVLMTAENVFGGIIEESVTFQIPFTGANGKDINAVRGGDLELDSRGFTISEITTSPNGIHIEYEKNQED